MNYNLNIIERMILETLRFSEKEIVEIQEKTSIELNYLNKAIRELITKNLILIHDGKYSLNQTTSPAVIKELNHSHSLISEVNEIISSCLREKIHTDRNESFKLKKVNMTSREETIFRGLVYNIESFLNSLTSSDNIKDQTIFFWGEGRYADIQSNILNF